MLADHFAPSILFIQCNRLSSTSTVTTGLPTDAQHSHRVVTPVNVFVRVSIYRTTKFFKEVSVKWTVTVAGDLASTRSGFVMDGDARNSILRLRYVSKSNNRCDGNFISNLDAGD